MKKKKGNLMRKLNTILAAVITILFLDHIVFAALYLMGFPVKVFGPMAIFMIVLVLIHGVLSMILTVNAEKTGMKTKARYNKENRTFWLRRTTGVLILVLVLFHFYAMGRGSDGIPRIAHMGMPGSLATILLALSVMIHININLEPLCISLGIRNYKKLLPVLKVLVFVLCLLAAAAVVVRHLR